MLYIPPRAERHQVSLVEVLPTDECMDYRTDTFDGN